jgi:hypothetical protein
MIFFEIPNRAAVAAQYPIKVGRLHYGPWLIVAADGSRQTIWRVTGSAHGWDHPDRQSDIVAEFATWGEAYNHCKASEARWLARDLSWRVRHHAWVNRQIAEGLSNANDYARQWAHNWRAALRECSRQGLREYNCSGVPSLAELAYQQSGCLPRFPYGRHQRSRGTSDEQFERRLS